MKLLQVDPKHLPADRKPADFLWQAVDLIFPPFCCHCGRLGFEICPECFSNIELHDQSKFCEKCGQTRHISGECQTQGIFFDRFYSWGVYNGPLKSVVQKIKYRRGIRLVVYIVPHISEFISYWFSDIDVFIPLPLGTKRDLSRGYNQTALFAKPVAEILGATYLPAAVERTRETISQVGLSAVERKNNIHDAFDADEKLVNGLNILLLDDITTTGSTINECAKALKQAGAASVSCFTLAKAKKPNLILEAKWIKR